MVTCCDGTRSIRSLPQCRFAQAAWPRRKLARREGSTSDRTRSRDRDPRCRLYAKTLQIEHLKAQLAVLRRARFGRSSEKLDREIAQLELMLGELEEGLAEALANVRHEHSLSGA